MPERLSIDKGLDFCHRARLILSNQSSSLFFLRFYLLRSAWFGSNSFLSGLALLPPILFFLELIYDSLALPIARSLHRYRRDPDLP